MSYKQKTFRRFRTRSHRGFYSLHIIRNCTQYKPLNLIASVRLGVQKYVSISCLLKVDKILEISIVQSAIPYLLILLYSQISIPHPLLGTSSMSRTAVHEGKGKDYPTTCHEGPEGEYRYGSTLYWTSALEWSWWPTPPPGHFTPGNRPDTVFIEGWVGLWSCLGGCRKISPSPGFDLRTGP